MSSQQKRLCVQKNCPIKNQLLTDLRNAKEENRELILLLTEVRKNERELILKIKEMTSQRV